MLHDAFLGLWFFLPAAAANAAPIAAASIPLLRTFDTPIDFNMQWRHKPLLGPHKTWRGFVAGAIIATVVLWVQILLARQFGFIHTATAEIPYATLPLLVMGPALGIGALLGDAVKSFFKRRIGMPSGHTWLPFDQIDYVIGGTLASLCFIRLQLSVYLWIGIIWFVLHLVASWIGWKLGLKERPI